MSGARKIPHRAEALRAAAKVAVGRFIGSRRLQTRGRRDQAKGNIKQYGAKIKEAFRR